MNASAGACFQRAVRPNSPLCVKNSSRSVRPAVRTGIELIAIRAILHGLEGLDTAAPKVGSLLVQLAVQHADDQSRQAIERRFLLGPKRRLRRGVALDILPGRLRSPRHYQPVCAGIGPIEATCADTFCDPNMSPVLLTSCGAITHRGGAGEFRRGRTDVLQLRGFRGVNDEALMADHPIDRSDADESNVSHFLFRTPPSQAFLPQFPLTANGQLARVFKQEFLDNERQRRLDEANELAAQHLEQAAQVARQLAEAAAAASAAASAASAVAERLVQLSAAEPEPEPDDEPVYRSVLHPSDWRSYAGFRASLIEAEADVRKERHLKAGDPVRKWWVAGAAGVSVKQLARIEEHFGLDVKTQWPPSTWPEQEPKRKFKQTTLLFTHAAAAVLVMAGCLGKIDPVRWLGS